MSDHDDQNDPAHGVPDTDKLAEQRASKLSRALATARAQQQADGPTGARGARDVAKPDQAPGADPTQPSMQPPPVPTAETPPPAPSVRRPSTSPEGAPKPSAGRVRRKLRLPPPPPPDPDDLRALGLPPLAGGEAASAPQPARPTASQPQAPLVLGEGDAGTRVDRAGPPVSDAMQPPETRSSVDSAPDPTIVPPADAPGPRRGLFQPVQRPPDAPSLPKRPTLLHLHQVHTDIGRYKILQGVDLVVPEGGVTMLLGRNGVGKTTTLRTIMGLWRAGAGEIQMDGRNLATLSPAAIARKGIGFVPEDMGIFGDLSVEENMRLGALSGRLNRVRVDWLMHVFPALATFWRAPAGNLSGGQKQMLSIARTIVERRRLYLIDEPTKGLAPAIVSTLVGALRELKHEGATILMVEQNFAVARALGDTCAVMEDGRVIWSGAMADLANDTRKQEVLMGLSMEPTP